MVKRRMVTETWDKLMPDGTYKKVTITAPYVKPKICIDLRSAPTAYNILMRRTIQERRKTK